MDLEVDSELDFEPGVRLLIRILYLLTLGPMSALGQPQFCPDCVDKLDIF